MLVANPNLRLSKEKLSKNTLLLCCEMFFLCADHSKLAHFFPLFHLQHLQPIFEISCRKEEGRKTGQNVCRFKPKETLKLHKHTRLIECCCCCCSLHVLHFGTPSYAVVVTSGAHGAMSFPLVAVSICRLAFPKGATVSSISPVDSIIGHN